MQTNPFDKDGFHEECGVFGIFGHQDAAALTALGLHALQHRGQEACGIVSVDGHHFNAHRALGLVDATFSKASVMERLKGDKAIGHNRYATSGDTILRNVQPIYGDFSFGGFALAHNGNLTNAYTLRHDLVQKGALFQSTSDTEVILHLVASATKNANVAERLKEALNKVDGAYSLLALTDDALIAVRDPSGVRPLLIGKLGNSTIVTSESCALDIIGAEYVRDVEPGEAVFIDKSGMKTQQFIPRRQERFCIFEYVYFARPDSIIQNKSVYNTRRQIGVELAKEAPCQTGDVVVPVPDSGVPSAIGYAAESGLPFELGIIRNHYVGRTFIEPTDQIRHLGVKLKHNANKSYIEGKSVVLVDDSIVRGTTSRKIVEMVREAGAKEVHMRISSPPTKHSCYYGIDTPNRDDLIANQFDLEEMARQIGADSLAYISLDGLYRATGDHQGRPEYQSHGTTFKSGFCDACFSGDYPITLTDHDDGRPDKHVSALHEVKRA
jgi:amidophosphoribosyltransferase